jgi:hypothetical protein
MRIDGEFDVLPDSIVSNLIEDIQNPNQEICSEYSLGGWLCELTDIPMELYLGVSSYEDDDNTQMVVYVYLPNRRAHNETDSYTENMDEPADSMFEESLKLNQLSADLFTLLDTIVSSVSVDDTTLKHRENSFHDCSKPSDSAYYVVEFPYSDIDKIEI